MAKTRADLRSSLSHAWRVCEMILLFAVLPVLILLAHYPHSAKLAIYAALVALTVLHAWWNKVPPTQLGMGSAGLRGLLPTLLTGAAAGALIFVLCYAARSLFGQPPFTRGFSNPFYWILFFLVYGIWALAQEFAARAWFFWRYGNLFPRQTLVLINGILFGWAHLFYGRWEPVFVTILAGILMAWIYDRYKSLIGITLVHLIGGAMLLIFNVGHLFDRLPR